MAHGWVEGAPRRGRSPGQAAHAPREENQMTSLQRLGIEIAVALLLVACFVGWWKLHNHTEQAIGAQQCIEHVTETKSEVVADNRVDQAQSAAQLANVVRVYDDKVSALQRDNAALSRGVFNQPVRASAAADPRPAACGAAPERGLSDREIEAAARQSVLATDLEAVLNACDADHAKLDGAVS